MSENNSIVIRKSAEVQKSRDERQREMVAACLEADGAICPYCGSSAVGPTDSELKFEDGLCHREMSCDVCGKLWDEVWGLLDVKLS